LACRKLSISLISQMMASDIAGLLDKLGLSYLDRTQVVVMMDSRYPFAVFQRRRFAFDEFLGH